MPKQTDKINQENIKKISINEKFFINDIEINSFSTPHDAANPCGFTFTCGNKKISIATDIGQMTNKILNNFWYLY